MIQGYPVAFRAVPAALFADSLYPGGFSLLQVVLPDVRGIFPWHAGCDPQYARLQAEFVGTAPRPTH